MGYIRFRVRRTTDAEGRTEHAYIRSMESDMPQRISPEYIYQELSRRDSRRVKMWLKMDVGVIDRDMLGGADALVLDTGLFDCDLMK